jgi:hypothetical protein
VDPLRVFNCDSTQAAALGAVAAVLALSKGLADAGGHQGRTIMRPDPVPHVDSDGVVIVTS